MKKDLIQLGTLVVLVLLPLLTPPDASAQQGMAPPGGPKGGDAPGGGRR